MKTSRALTPAPTSLISMDFQQLGPYVIQRQIGRGGMGTVFAGVESASGVSAAVKVLSVHLAQDQGFRERFEAEIETLRKLRHPNIVRLYGFGEQESVLFYAMELVEGTSLEEELRRGRRFDWRETTRIGIQLCRALRHAHDRGVIHRDIKPANLLLVGGGTDIKLSDFGIAKLFGSSGMTADGGVIGTADYMAPEQADGRPVTHRADLYSVGGLLYALTAGRPPFQARSLPEMLHMQRFAEPDPLRVHAPDVPHELEEIVRDLLVKEPEQRIPNAQVLARRLEAMEHGLLRRAERDAAAHSGDIHTSATAVGVEPGDPARPAGSAPPRPDQQVTHVGSEHSFSIGTPRHSAQTLGETQAAVESDEIDRLPVFWTSDSVTHRGTRAKSPEPDAHPGKPAPATPAGASIVAAERPQPRFVSVSEDEDLDDARAAAGNPLISPQTLVLVAALVSLGAIVWYFLQPPAADALYARVRAAADENRPERLADSADDIKEFLSYYPDDHRGRELQRYLDDIDLYRLEVRYRRGGAQPRDAETFTTLERAYAEALRLIDSDPDRGETKLRGLLALYGSEPDLSEREQQCLKLAERHLDKLRSRDGEHEDDLARLEQRLAAADADANRQAASRIYQGLIDVYRDKPWARGVVDAARAKLAESASQSPQPAPDSPQPAPSAAAPNGAAAPAEPPPAPSAAAPAPVGP
ncbi:MAG: serine/threonine protein kinase [Planctomycetaceae bacterium]|nr:serine/threonine protein kinase [Planctomycetaceae bacterium]